MIDYDAPLLNYTRTTIQLYLIIQLCYYATLILNIFVYEICMIKEYIGLSYSDSPIITLISVVSFSLIIWMRDGQRLALRYMNSLRVLMLFTLIVKLRENKNEYFEMK